MNLTIKSLYDLQIKSFRKARRIWLIFTVFNLILFCSPLIGMMIAHETLDSLVNFWWGAELGVIILSFVEFLSAHIDLKLCYYFYNMDIQFSASQ